MKVTSNSSPLMGLSVIGKLNLLKHKFGEILIPEAVWQETVIDGKYKRGTDDIQRANWINVVPIKNESLAKALQKDIDYGESEAIVLAMECKADFLLVDDKLARAIALNFGLEIMGTVGILIWAKQKGLISELQVELENLVCDRHFQPAHQPSLAYPGERIDGLCHRFESARSQFADSARQSFRQTK